jgi:hypothetical protein
MPGRCLHARWRPGAHMVQARIGHVTAEGLGMDITRVQQLERQQNRVAELRGYL